MNPLPHTPEVRGASYGAYKFEELLDWWGATRPTLLLPWKIEWPILEHGHADEPTLIVFTCGNIAIRLMPHDPFKAKPIGKPFYRLKWEHEGTHYSTIDVLYKLREELPLNLLECELECITLEDVLIRLEYESNAAMYSWAAAKEGNDNWGAPDGGVSLNWITAFEQMGTAWRELPDLAKIVDEDCASIWRRRHWIKPKFRWPNHIESGFLFWLPVFYCLVIAMVANTEGNQSFLYTLLLSLGVYFSGASILLGCYRYFILRKYRQNLAHWRATISPMQVNQQVLS